MRVRRTGHLVALDRHPLVVYLLALCVLSGALNLVSPNPAAPHVPGWINVAWYLLLVVGGLTALAGVFWPEPVAGVLVVRAGLLPVGAGAYAYALAVGHGGRPLDLVSAVLVAGLGLAAHWRVVQATLHVRAEMRRRLAPSGQWPAIKQADPGALPGDGAP